MTTLPMLNADARALARQCFGDARRQYHEEIALLRGWRDKALLELLWGSGLRRAEAAALRVGDIDAPNGWCRVTGKGGRADLRSRPRPF